MRILYATDTFLPEVNGVTTVLAAMRQSLRARGHEVLLIAPRYGARAPDDEQVHRLPGIPCPGYAQVRLTWPWGRGLDGVIARFGPDLIHAVTEGPLGSYGRRFALSRSLPLVTSFHTDFPRYAERYLGSAAVGPTRRWLRRFHSAAVLTQTPSVRTRGELIELGIAHASVWGRGVDTHWFSPARRSEARRAELGVSDRGLVLHVGRLAVEKDVDTLVGAFRTAHGVLGDRALFCVAGDGPRARSVRLALPFARHLGFLDRGSLADLYADSDLFVFPSPTETCGLVALEALASGVPVVAANAGGVPENVIEGITGSLVPAGDADGFARSIVLLLADPLQHAAMREGARAFAIGRDWNREMDELESAYARARYASRAEAAPMAWPTSTSVT